MTNSSAITMLSEMAARLNIKDVSEGKNKALQCAVDMSIIDIKAFGIEDWVGMCSTEVVKIFKEIAHDTLGDIIDEVVSISLGEELIDELLEGSQDGKLNYRNIIVSMKEVCIQYFEALEFYLVLHKQIKDAFFDNQVGY